MHDFTPVSALAGGALIGLASVWLLAANGRIAGISGILHGIFSPPDAGTHDARWRAWFISGLLLAGLAWQAAGLLVGFGTRMSGGCTSGHGVCGLGRLSARSLVAVLVFMASGMVSTYVVRHVIGVAS